MLTLQPYGDAELEHQLRARPDLANLAVAKVGANGKVSIYNNAGVTSVILDVVGWYGTPS